jgi:hypothetical protein
MPPTIRAPLTTDWQRKTCPTETRDASRSHTASWAPSAGAAAAAAAVAAARVAAAAAMAASGGGDGGARRKASK